MSSGYQIVERQPRPDEYARLRAAVGWWPVDPEASDAGLREARFSVCAVHDDEVIGCGRVVGDGGLYYYIQDVIVLPAFQGQGIGRAIMGVIMSWVEARARPGAFIGLMAARGVAPFYHRYGFTERQPERPGMSKVVPAQPHAS